ncbi:hypothetical protein GCM10028812_44270 [Ancylobacter sonchi]
MFGQRSDIEHEPALIVIADNLAQMPEGVANGLEAGRRHPDAGLDGSGD